MNDTTPPAAGSGADDPTPQERASVERLRAADPAATAHPDVEALRRETDERREEPLDTAVPARDELAARRTRWSSWPARAGVAAAALVIGGGGYALGAATPEGAEPAADVISLTEAQPGQVPAAGAEDAASAGTLADSRLFWPGYGGRTVFTASGLSQDGGTAKAWGLDPSQALTQEAVERAAAALGVPGAATQSDGMWTVGATDGSGPTVSVYPDGTASFSFYDPTKDPWSCVAPTDGAASTQGSAGTAPDEGAGGGSDDVTTDAVDPSVGIALPEPVPCEQRDLGAAPTGDAAAAQVRDTLGALGLDPASFEVVVEDSTDTAWTSVTAYHVVDGQRSGLIWSAALSGGGLQSVNGPLATLVDLGAYDVVSPTEAVERLGDPRFGAGGGPIAYLEDTMAAREGDQASVSPLQTVPPTAVPGSPIAWPVDQVTIVEARLGVALHTQADGAAVLVPTYELTGDDGGIWSVVAVADAQLDMTPLP
ncbi:hypothetical protein [Actinotalea subterranea]|uniref:hypothetical protein n=1 Tax=Actinotalea subterranea TaxID=2607497 RepID=UPI0011EF5E2E|nr:hypothetical protein [Actinotalea subterranea]